MSEPIYSTGNSKIKELVKLRESPKHRRKLKHFVIEGYTDLKCIFDFGRKIGYYQEIKHNIWKRFLHLNSFLLAPLFRTYRFEV